MQGAYAAPGNFVTIGLKSALFLNSRPEFRTKGLQFLAKCGPPIIWGGSADPSDPPGYGSVYIVSQGDKLKVKRKKTNL